MVTDKRPRHYADEILQLKTKAERKKALDNVPSHFSDWVRKIVEISYAVRANKNRNGKKG